MRASRFSIAGLMGAVVLLAALMAALRYPSPLLGNLAFSATVLALSLTLIGVIHARGADRVRCAGFLIAGGITFALHFIPWLSSRYANLLATAAFADLLYDRFTLPEPPAEPVPTAPPPPAGAGGGFSMMGGGTGGLIGMGGGFGGPGFPMGGEPPSPTEAWTSVQRPGDYRFGVISTRRLGTMQISPQAPAALQNLVDALAVFLTGTIGAWAARRFAARAAFAEATTGQGADRHPHPV